MLGFASIWTNIATIVIGCIALLSLGLLFVRASNIERRGLVSSFTLAFSGLALYLMITDAQQIPGREMPTAIAATVISILGFYIGRAVDASLGERSSVHADHATFGAELAD